MDVDLRKMRAGRSDHDYLWVIAGGLGVLALIAAAFFTTQFGYVLWSVFDRPITQITNFLIRALQAHHEVIVVLLALPFLFLRRETGVWLLGLAVLMGLYGATITLGNLLRVGWVFKVPAETVGLSFMYLSFGCALLAQLLTRGALPNQPSIGQGRGLWIASLCLVGLAIAIQIYDVPSAIRLVTEKGSEMSLQSRFIFRHGTQPQLYALILAVPAMVMMRRAGLWILGFGLFLLTEDFMKQWGFQFTGSFRADPMLVTLITGLVVASFVCFARATKLR